MEIVTMTKEEWLEKGRTLFGDNFMKWRFVCPSCGHIQAVEDFEPYKNQGATPDSARFNCIGRYNGHGNVDMLSDRSPCNYTNGGLIQLAPVKVMTGGEESWSFAFAPVENAVLVK